MSKTITIRLSPEQEVWLARTAKATGRRRSQIVREQIEKARVNRSNKAFMRLAGSVSGPADLSRRKGFSRS